MGRLPIPAVEVPADTVPLAYDIFLLAGGRTERLSVEDVEAPADPTTTREATGRRPHRRRSVQQFVAHGLNSHTCRPRPAVTSTGTQSPSLSRRTRRWPPSGTAGTPGSRAASTGSRRISVPAQAEFYRSEEASEEA